MEAYEKWGRFWKASTGAVTILVESSGPSQKKKVDTPGKTNGWIPKMMGRMEKVAPALKMAIFGIYLKCLGRISSE